MHARFDSCNGYKSSYSKSQSGQQSFYIVKPINLSVKKSHLGLLDSAKDLCADREINVDNPRQNIILNFSIAYKITCVFDDETIALLMRKYSSNSMMLLNSTLSMYNSNL